MIDIVERLRFDAARCELQFSKGVAGNIEEAAAEIERLRTALVRARDDLYDLGESDELLAPAVERIDAALRTEQQASAINEGAIGEVRPRNPDAEYPVISVSRTSDKQVEVRALAHGGETVLELPPEVARQLSRLLTLATQ